MGWFENQIEERRQADQQLLEDSFSRIAGVVLGHRLAEMIQDERTITKNAIDEIIKYYHYKPVELPDQLTEAEDQLDYCLRPHGLMRRDIELKQGWYKDAYGPILAFTKEEHIPVALLPGKVRSYTFKDPENGEMKKLNTSTETIFDTEAICFYRPLPQKKLGIPDLILYMKRCFSLSDLVIVVGAALLVSSIGLIVPSITRLLTGPVLESGRSSALIAAAIALFCISLSSQLFAGIKGMLLARLEIKTSLGVQSSMMMRVLSLPTDFFRQYSAGEMKNRETSVNSLCSLLLGMVLSTGLTSLTSLVYITQIVRFAPSLVIPSLIIIVVTVIFSVVSTFMQIGINKRKMEFDAQESGMSYSLISGIQKIKLSGAETRVFAKWMDLYAKGAELLYNPPTFIKLNSVISTAISLAGTIVLYYMAVVSNVSQADYFAFTASYGVVMGAFMSLSQVALSAAQIKPILEMAEPFLKAEPETSENKEIVTKISGSVELDHVTFRYSKDTPYIIDDLSLKIRPGQYVAIVGRTGCGKSTLLRLLLGFEKPEKGAVLYDGKNIDSLDLPSLRRKIGTVMQDAGLFQGDVRSNILITAPDLSLEDAWDAAEKAGIADDIREMPMGMHTIISEGQGGISGGQKQRIMIARAIAPNPRLLLLDEATSALDNKTQRQVSESLDAMGCTRIIIAHRLSTIRHCDRILVLEGGKIVEDGNYDQLIEKNGYFADLVERQRLDINEN